MYNRQTLEKTGPLESDDIFTKWEADGGLSPRNTKASIPFDFDSDVGESPTLTDAISQSIFLMKEYHQIHHRTNVFQLKYFEIGVYNGKTFRQVTNHVNDSLNVGLDMLDLNPRLVQDGNWTFVYDHGVLPQRFSNDHNAQRFIVRHNSALTQYSAEKNREFYHCACDVYDQNVWQRLYDHEFKFNLILSDALHYHDAILFEWRMIRDRKLLDMDGGFAYWFDDLSFDNFGVLRAFDEIHADIQSIYPKAELWKRTFYINGWLGIQEPPHFVGVITNIPKIATFPFEKK